MKRFWVIAVVGACFLSICKPASAQVFVSTSGATSASDLQQGNAFTQQRVKTYAELVKTAAVRCGGATTVVDSGRVGGPSAYAGRRSAQGCACSSWLATRISRSSRP